MKRVRILVGLAFVALSAVGVACVLADPPPIDPPPPELQPFILYGSVSPPASLKITAPPTNVPLTFTVPVLASVSAGVTFRVFVDLDPTSSATPFKLFSVTDDGGATGETPDADNESTRVFTFSIGSSTPIDFGTCHSFTFVVAGSKGFEDNASALPIDPPGGDQITWFYEPITDCTFYDAGPPTYEASDDGASE